MVEILNFDIVPSVAELKAKITFAWESGGRKPNLNIILQLITIMQVSWFI